MSHTSLKKLDELIANFKKFDTKPSRILVGYKAYADLMSNSRFSQEVIESALTPNKRKYKKIKIKVTQDEYQIEVI